MKQADHEHFMQQAITDAHTHFHKMVGGPFGACIVRNGEIISLGHNTVLAEHDPTCHAEINAIRAASKKLATHDLTGCDIYSTTEPCPMCFSAIHWANIDNIYYGTNIADVQRIGFNELSISNAQMKQLGKSKLQIHPDLMRDACLELLNEWQQQPDAQTY